MLQVLKRPERVLAATIFLVCAASPAQMPVGPAASSDVPTSSAPALSRVEGTDAGSGTHYVRLSVLAASSGTTPDLPPRFTLECRDVKGKHDLIWFLSFGGVPVHSFEPPFRPSQNDLFPPVYPKVKLKMDFEGYMRSKPYTKAWDLLPSGELRFCNSGINCP
ncbi:MAG: hypothetical protein WBE41_10680, partial [Terracidiphilus sp.]